MRRKTWNTDKFFACGLFFCHLQTILCYCILHVEFFTQRKLCQFKLKDVMTENERKYRECVVVPRRWGILPTLDMYIWREFMVKFCILLLVFVILFVLSDVFNDLSDFLDAGAPMSSFIQYLSLRLPGNIRFVLPIATLLGCMWTMAMFGKNLEITAMRASGVSLFRCGWSILFMGLLVACVNIYFNEYFVPVGNARAEMVKERMVKKRKVVQSHLLYRSVDRRRNWFFGEFSEGNVQRNVLVKFMRPDGTLQEDWQVGHAEYFPGRGWLFRDITCTGYSADGVLPKESRSIEMRHFSRKEMPETVDDINNAIKDEEELPSLVLWKMAHRAGELPDNVRDRYMTVFYYRLAFPWACFLAVFLGIPLATKNERSGSLLAIIMAVVIIIVYIVMAQVFLLLGKQGVLPPAIAGLAPTICFIIYGYCKVFYDKN